MDPLYFIIAIDIILIVVMIKFIFGSYQVFAKSVADHFFPDDVIPNPLEKFSLENDSRHKMNILYALVLFLAILTSVLYFFILR